MNADFSKYRIQTPEEYIGEVMGKLNTLGAWLEEGVNDHGVFSFKAKIQDETISEFSNWFNEISQGKGKVEILT